MTNAIVKVGILDDHPIVLSGYKAQLEQSPHIEVLWMARYYNEVQPHLSAHPPDVLILDASVDISPEDTHTFPILHEIPALLEKYPDMNILVISMHDRKAFIKAIQHAGASGYILKDDVESNQNLAEIIMAVAEEEIYYSPRAEHMLASPLGDTPQLTKRQVEILSYCASSPNQTTKQLAESLNLAHSTIRNHLSDIYLRLGVRKMVSAIEKARQLGLITPDIESI